MIKKCISVTSHARYPLPLSQTVTPSRTPSPERDVLYGRPLNTQIHTHTYAQIQAHIHTQTRNFSMLMKISFADKGFIIKTLFLWAFLK